jgi:hypothetical protein
MSNTEPGSNPPGYYKVTAQKLSFSGLVRMRGLLRAPLAYLITRFKRINTFAWAPSTWADLQCEAQTLSSRFHKITAFPRQEFKRLGFAELGFSKQKQNLNRTHLDDGGVHYLDSSRTHCGGLFYVKSHVPPPVSKDKEIVVISFVAVFSDGLLNCTNFQSPFDEPPQYEVVRVRSDDVETVYRCFLEHLGRRKETARGFPDDASFCHWFDANQREILDYRVRTGMFVKMSDIEVDAARLRLPPPLPKFG